MTVTAAAEGLGVTRKTLSELINGRSGISPEMAIRLSKAFGGSAEMWLGIQMDHDLARARKTSGKLKVRSLAVKARTIAASHAEISADILRTGDFENGQRGVRR